MADEKSNFTDSMPVLGVPASPESFMNREFPGPARQDPVLEAEADLASEDEAPAQEPSEGESPAEGPEVVATEPAPPEEPIRRRRRRAAPEEAQPPEPKPATPKMSKQTLAELNKGRERLKQYS